jgi:poly-gamma-glutamate capsule biosynthesis protein CapA/YwtB (metallophosphatase superfamily)
MKPLYRAIGVLIALLVGGVLVKQGEKVVKPVVSTSPSPVTAATSTPTPSPTPSATPKATSTGSITMLFGGDVMLGRTVETRIKANGNTWPFDSITSTLTNADITAVNLESPLRTDAASTLPSSLVLRGYPPGLAGVSKAGIDLVTLANNHIPDMGLVGLQETQKLLDAANIKHLGAGETSALAATPVVMERRGIKIGFLAYTYGVNFDSPGVHYNVADSAHVTNAVVVFCHCGIEYKALPNQMQQDVAHAAVDAGASLFIGAHPHVPEPFEVYKSGLILYSLGNLVFDQAPGENRDHSALVQVTLQGNKPTALKLIPYHIYDYGQPRLITDQKEKETVWGLFKLPTGQWP